MDNDHNGPYAAIIVAMKIDSSAVRSPPAASSTQDVAHWPGESTNMTTITVSVETRDRLRSQAKAARCSLADHLADLADLADRRARFDSLRSAIAATSDDERTRYKRETEEWGRVEMGDAERAGR